MVLKPDGIDFAPHLMQVESDRDKYAIQRIIAFYQAQPTDYRRIFRGRLALSLSRRSWASRTPPWPPPPPT